MEARTTGTSARAASDQSPTTAANQKLAHAVFALWIAAFLIKPAGSSWDIAWHFRYPFGTFEPPHLVNMFGSALAAALVVWHTMTGKATERISLLIIQGGFVLFLLSVPLDALNPL